jgi:hypothetical protein
MKGKSNCAAMEEKRYDMDSREILL